MKKHKSKIIFLLLIIVSVAFLAPVFIVLMNSFKNKLYISTEPFTSPQLTPSRVSATILKVLTKQDFSLPFLHLYW